ncbi:hypothetical protein FKW77_004021 [Venturia effusa]|uniref:Xylanolytic transcriptional activator regulatory domain-containing protein n=1 Tax=Venturia effusa TaxID=50376 RepID=A0A517L553_9PEZI|nr:hypothetical protein FKW77_004021 [Venturia effusa]
MSLCIMWQNLPPRRSAGQTPRHQTVRNVRMQAAVIVLKQSSNQEPAFSPRRPSNADCGTPYTSSGSMDSVIGTTQAPLPAELHYVPEISIPPQQCLHQTSINSPSGTIESSATIVKSDHSIPPVSDWPQSTPSLTTSYYQLQPLLPPNELIDYPEFDEWIPVPEHYPYQTDLDQISISYVPTEPSSPHLNAIAHMTSILPGIDQEPFLKSGASSPMSEASTAVPPVMILQNIKGSPYPLLFPVQRDKHGSLDLEGPLEDQQLGISLSLKTKQHYVELYWKHFHPTFPVLHRPTYQNQTSCPLLSAAVMSIGAQYDDGHLAKSDARILHQKCQELISRHKSSLRSATRPDYMQAIFLVEMFSHFKAQRANPQSSDMFNSIYARLGKWPKTTLRLRLQSLATIEPNTSENDIKEQWMEWINLHSMERLLTACYIFDAQQALLFARSTFTEADFGLDLHIPASVSLWEAPVHTRWANLLRGGAGLAPLVDVCQSLDSMTQTDSHAEQRDSFQSALITAFHASSVLAQQQAAANGAYGLVAASHPMFEVSNMALLEQALCPQADVLIAHNTVRLAAHSPIRALLAVSGESWVFSQRLASEALLADAEFETLKAQLRSWSETLRQPPLWPTSTGARSDPHEAIRCALDIIRLALDMDPRNLAFGGEMAVYYSSLVLWASTFRAVCKAKAAGLKFEDDDLTEFAASGAEQDARSFVQMADADINSKTACDGIPPTDRVDRWWSGVGAVLTWSARVIGGAGSRSNSAGELLEGAVVVLERLRRRGWSGDWF